jgi:DNA-directed RNA polymerase II subunit RPB1
MQVYLVKEILSLHKENKTSSLTIFLKEEDRENKERAKEILGKIEYSLLKNFLTKTEIYYEKDPYNTTIESDKQFVKDYRKYTLDYEPPENISKWIIRFELDSSELARKKLRISEIIKKIQKESVGKNLYFETTDENAKIPVIRIMIKQDYFQYENKHNKDEPFLVSKIKRELMDIIIRGIDNVTSVEIRPAKMKRYTEDGSVNYKQEYYLDTDGHNLLDILAHPEIDYKLTISNVISEIYDVLGIEAAVNIITNEIRDTFEDSGERIDLRYFGLLADVMCNRGFLMSIDRHGLNNSEYGPLAKSSFEEATYKFVEAAVNGTPDNLSGVSGNIMFGQYSMSGTGLCDLVLDQSSSGISNEDFDELF